ncbi:rho guanine nucleotide exchange factor 19 [Anguilla anguilla]|uniref:rho guanine nucleotide exchange factor 19 n=1 Tax=Anguilla anguilla TaxID=7936 RepID=UPI0015ACD98D|nr:rho guanine nucleotide exchange factor 19 [Anguilla anguilla]
MEVFFRPHTSPVTLRRQAAMRHRSSSSSQQGAVAQHAGTSSPERRNDDGGYPDHATHCEAEGNLPALDNGAPVNSEELGDLEVTGLQVPSEDEAKGSYEDLMEALCSPAGGIAAALRSVASCDSWIKGSHVTSPVPRLFSYGQGKGEPGETQAAGEPSLQITPPREGLAEQRDAEETKEEDKPEDALIPQSKYIHILPLYQDYWLQCVREELSRKRDVPNIFGLLTPPHHDPADPVPRSRSLNFSLWQDLPEVRESGLLDVLTAREKRLQEAMFEMIGSEASYLKSLMVAVSHFLGSQELRLTLPKMEHHILFSNLPEVKRVSERFLQSLESRLGDGAVIPQVGDLVLQHRAALRSAYVPYVTNMMYQEALVCRLLRGNREFVEALRKLEDAPVCQRQSLKSFLVLPFQRITRLRIILENVLKLTPPDSEPAITLKEAIAAIHQIVTECDSGVQRMKQTEELVRLDKLVDFGSVKSIPLISRGRRLLRDGPLRQVIVEGSTSSGSIVSFKDIYLHLFNDLLLLSLRQAGRFSVLDYSAFPARVGVGQLKAEILGLPTESFLLRLSRNHTGAPTALILAADTSSDREAWIMTLSSQTNGIDTQDL